MGKGTFLRYGVPGMPPFLSFGVPFGVSFGVSFGVRSGVPLAPPDLLALPFLLGVRILGDLEDMGWGVYGVAARG